MKKKRRKKTSGPKDWGLRGVLNRAAKSAKAQYLELQRAAEEYGHYEDSIPIPEECSIFDHTVHTQYGYPPQAKKRELRFANEVFGCRSPRGMPGDIFLYIEEDGKWIPFVGFPKTFLPKLRELLDELGE
jgi:hypothetical protein